MCVNCELPIIKCVKCDSTYYWWLVICSLQGLWNVILQKTCLRNVNNTFLVTGDGPIFTVIQMCMCAFFRRATRDIIHNDFLHDQDKALRVMHLKILTQSSSPFRPTNDLPHDSFSSIRLSQTDSLIQTMIHWFSVWFTFDFSCTNKPM